MAKNVKGDVQFPRTLEEPEAVEVNLSNGKFLTVYSDGHIDVFSKRRGNLLDTLVA